MRKLSGRDLAIAAAKAMEEKKAEDIIIMRMNGVMVETDYFVIGNCSSFIQMRAVSGSVLEGLERLGATPRGLEGRNDNRWMLLDYGDVVVHIFLDREREYYNLEKLWADAEKIPF